tara:strand:+ start:875 stop:1528 length:654 start_codon:yes stop_codon:yes gene_type:complete
MDGNQRWAKNKKVNIRKGYLTGLDKIEEITKICINQKIQNLTLFALSSENVQRSNVKTIFDILLSEYKKRLKEFSQTNNIKIRIIGEKENLPKSVINILDEIEKFTQKNKKLNLNIAFNYGTDKELLSIVRNISNIYKKQKMEITSQLINKYTYLPNISDPDLLIRTGGHQRLSNFMLLRLSYTELFFTKTLWPDLQEDEIINIFKKFNKIERKYGL